MAADGIALDGIDRQVMRFVGVVLRLGDWRFLLAGTKEKTEVRVLAKPDGAEEPQPGAVKLSYIEGCHHRYVLAFDPKVLGFKDEIPLNVRVCDNDGKGFDGWIEYSPLDSDCPAVIRLRELPAVMRGRHL